MSPRIPSVREHMTLLPHTIQAITPLVEASKLMREHHLRHLPVLRGTQLVGLLSERELGLVESLDGIDPNKVAVEDAMTQAPWSTSPETPLDEVTARMAEHRYGAVVLEEHGRVVGIFTTVDACRTLTELLRR